MGHPRQGAELSSPQEFAGYVGKAAKSKQKNNKTNAVADGKNWEG